MAAPTIAKLIEETVDTVGLRSSIVAKSTLIAPALRLNHFTYSDLRAATSVSAPARHRCGKGKIRLGNRSG